MTVSHHSHSGEFCCHAKGTLAEVVDEAIRQGFTTFGLSEHVPRYEYTHLYPEEVRLRDFLLLSLPPNGRLMSLHPLQSHLSLEDLATTFEKYLVEAHRLKKQHADKLSIIVGLETEYIDVAGLDKLEQLIACHPQAIEYLVGSVHHCDELPIDFDKEKFDYVLASQPGSSEHERLSRLFCTYFDNQLELLTRLEPEIVGHFDLCRLYYPSLDFRSFPEVWERIERNIEFAVGYGAIFEVNASAFRKGWTTAYPGTEVFDASSSLCLLPPLSNSPSSTHRRYSPREDASPSPTTHTVRRPSVCTTTAPTTTSGSETSRSFGSSYRLRRAGRA